jgi:hypothetical protein
MGQNAARKLCRNQERKFEMAYVNWVTYEAQLKVVYYGPAYAGKTTSLRYLSLRLETEVKELPTTDDRSVFFEYTQSQKLPANNLEVKFLYWTLPYESFMARRQRLTEIIALRMAKVIT